MNHMQIKMKTTAAGPDGVLLAGHSYTVVESFGKGLCDGGYAEDISPRFAPEPVVESEPVDEVADAEPVIERAVSRGRRGRR